jgi:hypothetical protein
MFYKIIIFTFFIFSLELSARPVVTNTTDDYFRIYVDANKELLNIRKSDKSVVLKTLDQNIYNNVKKELSKSGVDKRFIKRINYKKGEVFENSSVIEFILSSSDIEFFTFFREREGRYILDFWTDRPMSLKNKENKVVAVVKKKTKKKKITTLKQKKDIKFLVKKQSRKRNKNNSIKRSKNYSQKNKDYRDFRYGASFMWDYKALEPENKKLVDIQYKTPEYFHPIKDRDYKKSNREAHIQLTINLYRKKKWGLMYKAMSMYSEKYQSKNDIEMENLFEYLKANAIVKTNLEKGERGPQKMAISMYNNIVDKSNNFEIKKAILRYLMVYYDGQNDHVNLLIKSKQLFSLSKENFDYEELPNCTKSILYSLSKLNQIDKIQEVIEDKTVVRLLPGHTLLSYKIYSLLKLGNEEEIIRIYEKNKKSLIHKDDPVIIFNVAEAYFRKAQYAKAIKMFDRFISKFSYMTYSSYARLRIALGYDILDKDPKKIMKLYESAINRVQIKDVSQEAKLRYVAFRTIRKNKIDKLDIETRIFLERDSGQKISAENMKLLWLVRLRTYIKDKDFKKALAYLKAIPLNTLRPTDRRVFQADGAEVAYGLLIEAFEKSDYSNVVRLWQIYKDEYISKVAMDPYLNFIVGKSYLKLNFYSAVEQIGENLKTLRTSPAKTYPIWIERHYKFDSDVMLTELVVRKDIRLKNYKKAQELISLAIKKHPEFKKLYMYRGIIKFKEKSYEAAIKDFEKYLYVTSTKHVEDKEELAQLVRMYTDSYYRLNKIDRFKTVTNAILADTQSVEKDNRYFKSVRERLQYLNLEIDFGARTNLTNNKIIKDVREFIEQYKETIYKERLTYMLAKALVDSNKLKEGEKILNELINDESTSGQIKELSRSEISMMNLRNRKS